MRGDSIRDRYAKGLALLGLGMLAGAGAIVDYWPASGPLPLVPPVEREAWLDANPPVFADPFAIVVPAPASGSQAETRSVPPLVLPAASQVVVTGQPVTLQTPPRLSPPAGAPPAEPPVATFVAAAGRVPLVPVSLQELPEPSAPSRPAESMDTLTADATDEGFFSGAIKATSASIVRSSARAGLSVFDAVRSLGGAIGRALPN